MKLTKSLPLQVSEPSTQFSALTLGCWRQYLQSILMHQLKLSHSPPIRNVWNKVNEHYRLKQAGQPVRYKVENQSIKWSPFLRTKLQLFCFFQIKLIYVTLQILPPKIYAQLLFLKWTSFTSKLYARELMIIRNQHKM